MTTHPGAMPTRTPGGAPVVAWRVAAHPAATVGAAGVESCAAIAGGPTSDSASAHREARS